MAEEATPQSELDAAAAATHLQEIEDGKQTVQSEFLAAATSPSLDLIVLERGTGQERTITIKRWTLTQQVTLGDRLGVVYGIMIEAINQSQRAMLEQQQKGDHEVKLSQLMVANTKVGDKLRGVWNDCLHVLVGTLERGNPDLGKVPQIHQWCEEQLDLEDALKLLMLIASQNTFKLDNRTGKGVRLAPASNAPSQQVGSSTP